MKGLHNKALKPLIVNLHGLDNCLITWVWWNPILTLEWIPWNQNSMCVSLKWMKTLLTCNMMFTTSISNKDIHAYSHPLFLYHLHPLLLLKREPGVKELHNKALKPLIVNLHGLDKCLITWVWWNPILTLKWIPWNQTSMCVSLKWMKTLLTCNMMFITFMSIRDIHALFHPLFHHHLHPLLLPSFIFFLSFVLLCNVFCY